jgi:predicted enzyme related to lactoylglutathione lyase
MPKKTSHEPGTFSWVELTTTDAGAAKEFYAGLFGWTFDDTPAGPGMTYTMIKLGNDHVGGLFQMGDAMKGMPPTWASYITVEDADKTAKLAAENGATVLKEPFDVMDAGRMAVIADPTGAVFCIWQPKRHPGAGVVNEPGALCWNELFTNDVDRAGKFYIDTIGWTTEAVDMGPAGAYTLFKKKGETSNKGGMMPMKGIPPHWLAYFAVESCDASTKKASELGGKVMMQPRDLPDVGRFSILTDPTGATFALFETNH